MTGDGGETDRTGTSADSAGGEGGEGGAAPLPEGLRVRGEVVAVERVPAAEVPAGFPVTVESDEALALRLKFARHDARASTYLPLPAGDPDGRLGALLAVHGVDEPAQLSGAGVLLDIVDGHPVPVAVDEPGRGDPRAVYGVLAGLAPSITIALLSFFGLGEAAFSPVYVGLYLVCTFLVLPVSIYIDAWHLRSTTDWAGRPLRWALLSVVPPLYVVVVPYYLLARENARPLAVGPSRVA